jgi:serine/threonine protein kinase
MIGVATRSGIADYEFVRFLADLGKGEYYLAHRPPRLPVEGDLVAVKILSGSTTDEAFDLATRELRAFASVESPYLVRLFDAGQEGDTFYYAMEYHSLGSLAVPARPLSRDEVLRAVSHAARATHALHEAGIAHCDIKPANVLLREDGGCLADLGLAQVLNPGQTVSGMADTSSIEFVDPALMLGGAPGRATDIWSLAATLHRVLTGAGLYGVLDDSDPLLALRTVLSGEPVVSAELSDREASLIAACLDPDPAQRPLTAAAVADTIESWSGT